MLRARMLLASILALGVGQPPALPPVAAESDYLDWQAPASCPSAGEVRASVAELAGRSPDPQEVAVRAVASSDAGGWQLQLSTRAGRVEQLQTLRADSCEGLADATALIVAVMLDPVGAASRISVAEPVAERGLTPAPEPAPAAEESPPEPEQIRTAPTRWSFGLGLGLGGERGAVPRGTGGARLTLFARRRRFEARVHGSYWIPRATREPGARVQLGTAGVAACFVPAVGALQIPVCAGLEGGGLQAQGDRVPNDQTATLPWLAATVGPSLRWWVRPRFGLFAAAEAFLPLVTPQVTLRSAGGQRVVHQPAVAGFRGFLGISVRFSGAP